MPGRKLKPQDAGTYRGRIGEIIRARRIKKKLTIMEAAEKAETPVQTWYNWERGRYLPLDALPAIAAALGCKPRMLLPE